MAPLRVEESASASWPYAAGDDVPLPASREWIQFMKETAGSEPLALLDESTGIRFLAFAVRDEDAPPPANLRRLLTDPTWLAGPEAAEPRAATVLRDGWTPSLLVMFPGMATFPVPALDPPLAEVRATIGRIAAHAAKAGFRTLAFPYVWPEARSTAAALAEEGFEAFPASYRSDLDVEFSDFDGYLASLSGSRRGLVRRDVRRLRAAGVRTALEPLDGLVDRLASMRLEYRRRYRLGGSAATERRRLLDLHRRFGGDDGVSVFVSYADGRPLRFSLSIRQRETWYMLWTGADYDAPEHRLTYFDCLFYEPVRVAPSLGIGRIVYGLGDEEAKALRGCVTHRVTCFVRPAARDGGGA